MSAEKYRLHAMPSAQCHIVIQHDTTKTVVELISYSTSVLRAVYENDSLQLYCSGTYSMTSARHINRFTTEFFGINLYHECAAAVNKKKCGGEYYLVIELFNVSDNCSCIYKQFFNTIHNYENDSFGIGAVKKYRGHY